MNELIALLTPAIRGILAEQEVEDGAEDRETSSIPLDITKKASIHCQEKRGKNGK